VERTFAWLGRYRRLAKDYEYLARNSETMIHIAMIHLMSRRLLPGTGFLNTLLHVDFSRPCGARRTSKYEYPKLAVELDGPERTGDGVTQLAVQRVFLS
jgi:hypothetical protein